MAIEHMTTYNTIAIARAFTGDLFILDADDGVINVIDGCFPEDNGFKDEVKIPVEKGIYKCQCKVSSNGDDFSIEILNAERMSFYTVIGEPKARDGVPQGGGLIMQLKQAINWLRKEKDIREGHEPTDYITLAMQALEKQVPKKVIDRDFCPTCKQYLGCESFEQQYCDKCGQRLDWIN